MRKRIWTLIIVIAVFAAAGCVPSQYRNGVETQKYPHDELPVYDDAVIYEYEEEEEKITIKYGTSAVVEEIAEFYVDYFVSNEAEIDQQEIESDEYETSGFYADFLYEVKAEEAKGEYEEKLYETTVEVEIEFLTEQQINQRTVQKNQEIMVGFWEINTEEQYNGGQAGDEIRWGFEFKDDGTYVIHILNLTFTPPELTWEITDEGKLKWYDMTEEGYIECDIILEEHDGFLVFHLKVEDETMYLYRTDIEEYYATIIDANDLIDD